MSIDSAAKLELHRQVWMYLAEAKERNDAFEVKARNLNYLDPTAVSDDIKDKVLRRAKILVGVYSSVAYSRDEDYIGSVEWYDPATRGELQFRMTDKYIERREVPMRFMIHVIPVLELLSIDSDTMEAFYLREHDTVSLFDVIRFREADREFVKKHCDDHDTKWLEEGKFGALIFRPNYWEDTPQLPPGVEESQIDYADGYESEDPTDSGGYYEDYEFNESLQHWREVALPLWRDAPLRCNEMVKAFYNKYRPFMPPESKLEQNTNGEVRLDQNLNQLDYLIAKIWCCARNRVMRDIMVLKRKQQATALFMALHPRVGAESSIQRAFGGHNPLGDRNVFHLMTTFLDWNLTMPRHKDQEVTVLGSRRSRSSRSSRSDGGDSDEDNTRPRKRQRRATTTRTTTVIHIDLTE